MAKKPSAAQKAARTKFTAMVKAKANKRQTKTAQPAVKTTRRKTKKSTA